MRRPTSHGNTIIAASKRNQRSHRGSDNDFLDRWNVESRLQHRRGTLDGRSQEIVGSAHERRSDMNHMSDILERSIESAGDGVIRNNNVIHFVGKAVEDAAKILDLRYTANAQSDLVASFQGMSDDLSANKASGSGDEDERIRHIQEVRVEEMIVCLIFGVASSRAVLWFYSPPYSYQTNGICDGTTHGPTAA